MPIGGTTITPLVTGEQTPSYLVLDGGALYWTDSSAGTVSKVSTNGGAPRRLAIHQDGPLGLAVDASCVYFSDYAGGVAAKGSIRKSGKD